MSTSSRKFCFFATEARLAHHVFTSWAFDRPLVGKGNYGKLQAADDAMFVVKSGIRVKNRCNSGIFLFGREQWAERGQTYKLAAKLLNKLASKIFLSLLQKFRKL